MHEHGTAPNTLRNARDVIASRVKPMMAGRRTSVLIAIDGGSGAGKSLLGSMVASVLNAALIPCDDFYASTISNAEWDRRSAHEKVEDVIDWARLRSNALERLLRGKQAEWHPFDFDRIQPDGTYPLSAQSRNCGPASVIVLEGAYSSHPRLADLVDLTVLIDTAVEVRHRRLAAREDDEFLRSWHARWDKAEEYYFSVVRPKSSFDLVVEN